MLKKVERDKWINWSYNVKRYKSRVSRFVNKYIF